MLSRATPKTVQNMQEELSQGKFYIPKKKLTEDKLDEIFFDLRNKSEYKISNLYIFGNDSKSEKKFDNAISAYAKIKAGEKPLVRTIFNTLK